VVADANGLLGCWTWLVAAPIFRLPKTFDFGGLAEANGFEVCCVGAPKPVFPNRLDMVATGLGIF
jgi:hypothetical protein